MAYRSREYVPEVYQPNDGRLSELMYLQGQNQADRIQRAGVAQAALWANMGRTASGALSQLAQYKRDAPIRAEAERVRNEQAKLRGLEEMAGSARNPDGSIGMTEEERGKLLRREGFTEKGQEILDKDAARKDVAESRAWTQSQRTAAQMSDAVLRIDHALESADGGASTWAATAEGLKKQYPQLKDLPDVHDPEAIRAFRDKIRSGADILASNDRAEKLAAKMVQKEILTHQRIEYGKGVIKELGKHADTPQEWDAMIANIDSQLSKLPKDEADTVWAGLGIPRIFSAEAHQNVMDRFGDQPNNAWSAMRESFKAEHGHYPRTVAEERQVMLMSQPPRAAGTGSTVDARQALARKAAAGTEKNKRLYDLEKEYADPNNEMTEQQLIDRKEQIQQLYLSQIGAEDGPTLAQYEGARNRDVLGRSLAAQARPGAVRDTAAPAAPAAGAMVLIQSPDGQEMKEVPAVDAEFYVSRGARIVPQRGQAAPTAPPTPGAPAPTGPAAPQQGNEGPQLPTGGRITMRGPRGHIETIDAGGKRMFELLEEGWKILPPENDAVRDWAGQVGRDLTQGAPPRQPASTPNTFRR